MPSSKKEAKDAGSPALSHVVRDTADAAATRARMVDVSAKPVTERSALARAHVRFPAGMLELALRGAGAKGPLEETARCAGVLAAKRTGELIPYCHPLGLDHVDVEFERVAEDLLEVRCRARTTARTGVEMEALTGAALAALTVIDMTKALSKEIRIELVELLEKSGGKSGPWRRAGTPDAGAPGAR